MSLKTISETISEFVVNTKFEDIPIETTIFTKSLALKTLAGMIAGSTTEASKPIIDYVNNDDAKSEAGLLGAKKYTSIENAIIANGHFCHAAELEDDQFPSVTSDITVFPVIFSMAEKYKLSGRDVVESSTIALEVMNRIGMFSLAYRGITDLAFFGVIGAAVAAAKGLKLDRKKVENSIGIAIGRAGGYIANFGTDAHYLESSMACRDGYYAAVMAQKGLTGTTDIENWLKQLHSNQNLSIEKIVDGLGCDRWHVHNIWVKKYPCCFLTHRQIDIMIDVKHKYNLNEKDVNSVEIEVGPIDYTCNRPFPKHIEDSRFSFQHIVASILLEGDINYDSFTREKIESKKFTAVRNKIKVKKNESWPKEFNSGIAKVKIVLNNGNEYIEELAQPLGGSGRPLTEEQFLSLYQKYTSKHLNPSKIDSTARIILGLEKYDNISNLMNTLTYG